MRHRDRGESPVVIVVIGEDESPFAASLLDYYKAG
jgi:hypothetical protein